MVRLDRRTTAIFPPMFTTCSRHRSRCKRQREPGPRHEKHESLLCSSSCCSSRSERSRRSTTKPRVAPPWGLHPVVESTLETPPREDRRRRRPGDAISPQGEKPQNVTNEPKIAANAVVAEGKAQGEVAANSSPSRDLTSAPTNPGNEGPLQASNIES
jgi:hypothetical protein